MVYRIFVEKKPGLDNEAKGLLNEAKHLLGIENLENIRLFNRYDAENITEELFDYAVKTVFSEPQLDDVSNELNLPEVDPWIEDISLSEAEEIAGFKLELPDVIADAYVAVEYRAIEKEVIEATYVDEEYTVIIKRAIGVNQNYIDNSVTYTEVFAEQYEGNLSTYDITYFINEGEEIHTIINGNGYTWTIYAPNGYWGDSAIDFIHEICE